MNSQDVLSVYEQIAGLTSQMAVAAKAGDWDSLTRLECECQSRSRAVADVAVPALTGELRARKVALIKQIMANDKAIREVTDPWQAQLARAMH